MRATFKVSGLKELDAALGELAKATASAVGKRVLMKAAQPIVDEAKRLVPENTGRLKQGIVATTKKPRGHASKAAFAAAMRAGATRAQAGAAQRAFNRDNPGALAEAFVQTGRGFYAQFQEFGTQNHPPHPFMRPALEAKGEEAINIIAAEMRPEIDKAAERARRKAARKALKG